MRRAARPPVRLLQRRPAPDGQIRDECGTPTSVTSTPEATASTAPSDATRKTVTALFADLVGSTSFGERTDAEVA